MGEAPKSLARLLAIGVVLLLMAGSIYVVLTLRESSERSRETGVGNPFPPLDLQPVDSAGVPARVPSGRKTLLVFFRHDCDHCRQELARLDKACRMVPEGRLDCIAVSFSPEPVTRAWKVESGLNMGVAVARSPDFAGRHLDWLTAVPLVFMVDERGVVQYKRAGERDEAYDISVIHDFAERE